MLSFEASAQNVSKKPRATAHGKPFVLQTDCPLTHVHSSTRCLPQANVWMMFFSAVAGSLRARMTSEKKKKKTDGKLPSTSPILDRITGSLPNNILLGSCLFDGLLWKICPEKESHTWTLLPKKDLWIAVNASIP